MLYSFLKLTYWNNMQKKKSQTGFHQGWSTTDEQEIERRRKRGEQEPFSLTFPENQETPFGTYRVQSATSSGGGYDVELRSLDSQNNSCGCPDYNINRLGTCKHIEAVIHHLKQKHHFNWKELLSQKPAWAEVYLDLTSSAEIKLWNPLPLQTDITTKQTLDSIFSSEGDLLQDASLAISSLKNVLQNAPEMSRPKIKISKFIDSWLFQKKRQMEKQRVKEEFLEEVKQGKQTLNVLNVPLYPYQVEGMLHLAFNERALLADEMGLGKTIQAIAACVLLRRLKGIKRVLVIVPASLKTEWEEQILKFTSLPVNLIQGARHMRLQQYKLEAFFYLMNYEQVRNDWEEIQELLAPDVIILDEAQRIKNWQAKTSTKIKKLQSPYAFVLTGTPLENRIDEVYSLMQVIDPTLFGPLFRFNREFYVFDERGKTIGLKNIDQLHARLKGVLLRRRKHDVEDQLPDRLINFYFVKMEAEQQLRYDEYSDKVARLLASAKNQPLRKEESELLQLWLACMRMLCDSPYILDQTCRICPKLTELEEILGQLLADKENKIIIFSEWTKMLDLIQGLLKKLNIDYALHTGSVPQDKRRREINRFKEDPNCRLFLSSDSGATGLNLQVANVVINMDLPWNPAKYEQRIARAWRKHQKRTVQIINLVCEESIEHRMISLLSSKQELADSVLDGTRALEEMDLPSGKGAFLEKLESLMKITIEHANSAEDQLEASKDEESDSLEEIAPTFIESNFSPPIEEKLKATLLNFFPDKMVQIDLFENENGKKTLLIVSDSSSEEIEAVLPSDNKTLSLEFLDARTFEAIQKLIDAGILQMNDKKVGLFQSKSASDSGFAEQQRKLQKARAQFQVAERKFRMAKVLASGGFAQEAETPAKEALNLAWESLSFVPLNPNEDLKQLHLALKELEIEDEPQALRLIVGVQTLLGGIADLM